MSASEQDLELLETLLDGELPDAEASTLRARIANEPELSNGFQQIRAERATRQRLWLTMEPSEAAAATLLANVRSNIRKDESWGLRYRALRYVSGLAACIVIGFLFGRYVPTGEIGRDRGTGIIFSPSGGAVQEVINRPEGFKVQLTDNYGRVIAEQRFSTFDEARQFTEDLGRIQRPAQPLRVNDTVLIKGEF